MWSLSRIYCGTRFGGKFLDEVRTFFDEDPNTEFHANEVGAPFSTIYTFLCTKLRQCFPALCFANLGRGFYR